LFTFSFFQVFFTLRYIIIIIVFFSVTVNFLFLLDLFLDFLFFYLSVSILLLFLFLRFFVLFLLHKKCSFETNCSTKLKSNE